jgi:hypothetical protein
MDVDHLRALLAGERQEPLIVGHVYDPALVRLIRAANAHAVLLSRDTVIKQESRHPDIGFDQYRLLPYILRYGYIGQEWPDQLTFSWVDHDGRRYRAMVKATVRTELFVTSLHRCAAKQMKAIFNRAMMLRHHA